MSSAGPLILLPPSEGKAPGGDGPAWTPGSGAWPELDARRSTVVKALQAAMRKPVAARSKLLGVKGDALVAATATNLSVLDTATMPAIDRYTGVLYDELDASSLSKIVRRRFDEQVVIFSGLWGIVRPGDPIPDYKLKMGASIGRPGKLSTWWRAAVTDALAPCTANRVVWDLLPNEHRAAWAPPVNPTTSAPTHIVSVRFLDEQQPTTGGKSGELIAVAHWNKLLKGSLVRHIVAAQLDDPEGLADLAHPRGYVLRPELTQIEGNRTLVSMVLPYDRADDRDNRADRADRDNRTHDRDDRAQDRAQDRAEEPDDDDGTHDRRDARLVP